MYRIIEVVPYNPEWTKQFQTIAEQVQQALGSNCIQIHHIGSTAIPGLAAKPIIDMIPVVKDILQVDKHASDMQKIGFKVQGEFGILFRRYFFKLKDEQRIANVHAYPEKHPEIERHLMFRDYLHHHPVLRDQYGALKTQLAQNHPHDIEQYLNGKESFIHSIDQKTGFNGLRMVEARSPGQWDAYHRIRECIIFAEINISYNRNHPTIQDPKHKHILLIQGVTIVGTIQIEFLDEKRAAIRPFAIDTPYQNQGLGTAFLQQIECWLYQQGIKLVQLHANHKALSFYRRLGYEEMAFKEIKAPLPITTIDLGKYLDSDVLSG